MMRPVTPAPHSDYESAIARAREADRAGDLDIALASYEDAFRLLGLNGSAASAAELFRAVGAVHRRRGDLEVATEAYETSLAIAEVNGLRGLVAYALNSLAIVAQQRAEIAVAEALYTRAQELAQDVGEERLAAMIDQNIGTLANVQGRVNDAIVSYMSALGRFRRLGDQSRSALVLNNLGMAHVDLHDWPSAQSYFDEAFDIADRSRDTELLGTVELNRTELYLKQGDFARARDCCDRAFEIFTRSEARGSLGETYKYYGVLYREMSRPGLADAHFSAAVELAITSEAPLLEAEALSEWALVDLASGNNPEALQRLNRAHRLFGTLKASSDLLNIDSRLDKLEDTYLKVVQQWAESIESKDLYTAGHCQRVADYACMLAEAVGFTGRDLTWFRMGGYLHDVGKTSVPPEVLNKPGKLDDEEWKLMQAHTTVGDDIVADLNFPWDIRPMVRSHHERWDGTGYPDRLAGEAIPYTARILCVADVYDALTTARSYRPALSQEEALRIMERDVGRMFDPALFEIFRNLVVPELVAAA